MKIAIVGAGVCGLSAAKFLAQRGHRVAVFEQFELFHDRGSSHGASRIIRRAYPDKFYTACMAEAFPMWKDLEGEAQSELLHECGLLYFGSEASENLVSVRNGLTELDVPHEIFIGEEVKPLLPELRLSPDEIAIWTPEAGWLDAAESLLSLYRVAKANEADFYPNTHVSTTKLSAEFDAVIVAAGSWTPSFVSIPVTVTLQTFAYVEAQVGGPVWIEDSFDMPYGFPSDSTGQKIGIHRAGPSFAPDEDGRASNEEFLDIIRSTASSRFGIESPRILQSKTCPYTTTATEDFILGNLAPNTFFASACSGHGFKMGIWIGKLLADFAEGRDQPKNHPRFHNPTVIGNF